MTYLLKKGYKNLFTINKNMEYLSRRFGAKIYLEKA